jgi:hypothetical protein
MAFSQWMPISHRGGGEFYTSDFAVPANITWVNIRLDVDPVDFATSDLSVTAILEYSNDNGQNWKADLRAVFVGGPPPGKTGEWLCGCNGIDFYYGFRVRVHFVTVGSFRWGLSGETI